MQAIRFAPPACVVVMLLSAGQALAAESCESTAGHLASAEGRVDVQRVVDQPWQPAVLNQALCQGDSVRVGQHSRAAIALINDAVLRLDQNTTMRLVNIVAEKQEQSLLSLVLGAFQSFSRKPSSLAVNTPYLNATVEGTEFMVRVTAAAATVTVFEGVVVAANDQGSLSLASGQSTIAEAGKAPVPRVVVRPRDAVQWALHYPALLAVLGGRGTGASADLPAPLRRSMELAGEGDIPAAVDALDRIPAGQRDAAYHLQRAALLLSVGQVDDARADIDRALELDAASGLGYALRAVIAVVQNQTDQALADGTRAVELSPGSAAAKIALSYAEQAAFRLDQARNTMLSAVADQPDDALAWARLAELWLALGHRNRSRAAAEKAVALEPELARTQVVLGFAALTEFRTAQAAAAFGKAIALDSADPMPRLGLGLAKIRDGDLPAGRKDIEMAVGLDANNALLRAYLGKAYFEEKRAPLDGEQLAIAKQLDPNDPTAYLYDAIRLQVENRPGEALTELQDSIARNDNRAIYRSRLQLDQDRAARGTSLARVYDDLGFARAGVNEAAKSLTLDPGNASAHRFLSDMYGSVRRHEIARVSELLQAQLLQDININPVQPSISATNLAIVTSGGPADAGFNEFTPLFERNQVRLNTSGQVGNNDTWGAEGVVSGIYNQLSFSAGAYRFESDGFRENHDLDHTIYDLFAQAAITPDLNIQAEYRDRESDSGDLTLNFDPDVFNPTAKRELDQDITRLGARYTFRPGSNLLLSFIHSDRDEDNSAFKPFVFFGTTRIFDQVDEIEDDGDQYEGQYQHLSGMFNIIVGGGYSSVDRDRNRTLLFTAPLGSFSPGDQFGTIALDEDIDHTRFYGYLNVAYPKKITWTVGLSYDDLDRDGADQNEWNPKVGVQWNVTNNLKLRGTAFQIVKPVVVANRSIEPTQVAGFNQMHDDTNGTESTTYGVAIDWQAMPNLLLGAQATWRDYEEVVEDVVIGFSGVGNSFTISDPLDRDENIYRGYAYWNPIDSVAVSAEAIYDLYKSEEGTGSEFFPKRVETFSVPVSVRYFDPRGWFASLGATFVDQDVKRFAASSFPDGSDSFITVDVGVGYRLPKRRGVISLQVANLFDSDFDYQDDNYREFRDEPSSGPYIPDRTILARGSLQF